MRLLALAMLAIAACAPQPTYTEAQRLYDERMMNIARERREAAEAERIAAEAAMTPAQRAQRDFERAKTAREQELLQRALSNSPDYAGALRRAAEQNVVDDPASPRREATSSRARRVAAEEARLSDAVEAQRRSRVASMEAEEAGRRYRAAVAQCDGLAAQVEAGHYTPRSLLNLDGMIAGASARNRCIQSISP